MNKLCIVGYSFGDKYQSFIPFYIYSLLYNYPDYDVLVFSDCELNSNVKRMLTIIEDIGKFEVIENYSFGLKNSQKILDKGYYKQALRWLFYDKRFDNYEAIYIGDIDIFFCKEEKSLYEQHKEHADFLDLPYSNYVRLVGKKKKFTLKMFLYHLYKRDFTALNKMLKGEVIYENRLSGLHFVNTKEYYRAVKPLFGKYIDIITGKRKSDIINDEELLYYLIKESGLGLPPVSPNSPDLEGIDARNIAYRPHHGIHLGIYRRENTKLKQRQVIESYVYKQYFKQYMEIKKKDKRLTELINLSDEYVQGIFDSLEEYYLKN